jgi:hypothetical protein
MDGRKRERWVRGEVGKKEEEEAQEEIKLGSWQDKPKADTSEGRPFLHHT